MSTVSYGAIRLELRRARVKDGYLREWIVKKLQAFYKTPDEPPAPINEEFRAPHLTHFYRTFGRICSQCDRVEELPFALVSDNDNIEQVIAAWSTFWEMDDEFIAACTNALIELAAPVDGATGPQPLPEGAEKNS